MIPAAAMYARTSQLGHLAPGLVAGNIVRVMSPINAGLLDPTSAAHALAAAKIAGAGEIMVPINAASAGSLIDPTSAVHALAAAKIADSGKIMVPIDATSAASLIDPTSAVHALAAAKIAGSGEIMVPIDAASAASLIAPSSAAHALAATKYADDATAAELTGAGESWVPVGDHVLAGSKYAGAKRIAEN